MSLKKTLVGAVAVVSTLTVAGCGSAVDISGNAGASLTKSTFATALTRATDQATSVHMAGTFKAQGQTFTVSADESLGNHTVKGTVKGMAGDMTMTVPGMGTVEVRIVGGVVYLNSAELGLGATGGKPWVKIDLTDTSNPLGSMLSQLTNTMGPGQITDMLKGLATVRVVGHETVDGVATTHYRVSVDTAKLGSTLGLDPSELGGAALPKTLIYDIWLDSGSRPVKLTMATSQFSVDLHFSKWGEPVHVVAPPASQVSTLGL